jgi:GNAT superfamily N-acetyltransferase
MKLSEAAGWNQIPADWQRLLDLEPTGCFGIEVNGDVVATTTAICFGSRLAWIGMVLTDPNHRRQGHALRLMEKALEYLEQRRIDWIKLDATAMGKPLYERLGFEDEGAIERWSLAVPESTPAKSTDPYASYPDLDLRAFGADRSAILASLRGDEAASVAGQGFAMGRAGANAASFGPCVAVSRPAARNLLEWFLGRHAGETVFWDLLPANPDAVALAREFGFERQRELVRMVHPGVSGAEPLLFDDSLVYATAGFEYG